MLGRFLSKVLILTGVLLFYNCKTTYNSQSFNRKEVPDEPQYSKVSSWAITPSSYQENFKKYAPKNIDSLKVDVFYIYPTVNTSKRDVRWNAPIEDEKQNDKVVNKAVLFQASAFAEVGKIYAPLYRQAHYRSFFKKFKKEGGQALRLAYSDVKRAFQYYLDNFNDNRPIIIVGHSQGATHAIQLLKDFFDETQLKERLVAAYIPGMRIKPNEFKNIKPMKTSGEVGGFVSWNTYKKGFYPKPKDWYKGSVTTNPVTWNDVKETEYSEHKGFLYTNEKLYRNSIKTQITDGLVWINTPKFPLRFFASFVRNFHSGDINLFWQDVKENAQLRAETWIRKNK